MDGQHVTRQGLTQTGAGKMKRNTVGADRVVSCETPRGAKTNECGGKKGSRSYFFNGVASTEMIN